MKKFAALLLALMMALCAVSALADVAADVEAGQAPPTMMFLFIFVPPLTSLILFMFTNCAIMYFVISNRWCTSCLCC